MSISSNLWGVVKRFVTRDGQDLTLIKHADGGYDPDTGTVTQTITEYTVRGIILDYNLQSNGLQSVQGTLIEAGDKQAYVEAKDLAVKIQGNGDKLKINATGEIYSVKTVKEYNPTGAYRILYELMLRK